MIIFPAIDMIDGNAVRLLKGDYNKKTVYASNPCDVAKHFEELGAEYLHLVDLDGAKNGKTPNFDAVKQISENTSLKIEIGGGVRSEEVIKKYLDAGVFRVILGTAAINMPDFTSEMISKYKDKIAVGVDIKDGMAASNGWTEISKLSCDDLFKRLQSDGAQTVICTDISKDGAMSGTNIELYRRLSEKYSMSIVASGGITSIDDVRTLAEMNIYGAILGKSLYEGTIKLNEAIEVAE